MSPGVCCNFRSGWENHASEPLRHAAARMLPTEEGETMGFRSLFGAAMVVALLGVTGIASAAPSGAQPYTCTGGHIPSGNYASITVTGVCDVVPHAVISIGDSLNVAAGAVFNAQSAPSTITIGPNVRAGAGSL